MSDHVEELSGIRAIAGAVLPGDERYPSAADLPVAERILARLEHSPADANAFVGVVAATAAGASAAAVLADFASTDSAALRRIVQCVYAAYYEDPAVRAVLAQRHGYADRPPQPLGYRPFEGTDQLARLEERRVATLATSDWWLDRFNGLGA